MPSQPGSRNRLVRLLAILVIVPAFFLASWFLFGKSAVEKFVRSRSKPWAVFQVPASPTPLTGLEAKLAANVVTVCNRSGGDWKSVLVQIDQNYLAALDHLQAGECKQLQVRDFATESWKRMPPPADLQVTRVAVLATVAQKGYAQKSFVDQSALSSR
jgi:hypothetical protein